jgi:hypothetical protein
MNKTIVMGIGAGAGHGAPFSQSDFPKLTGRTGQKPRVTPELFAPGIVSTCLNELNSVFSPDGEEFYFASAIWAPRHCS